METPRTVSLTVTDAREGLSVVIMAEAPCEDHGTHLISKRTTLPTIYAHDFWAWAPTAVASAAGAVCPCGAELQDGDRIVSVEEGPGCER
jgi:hypothetical protein